LRRSATTLEARGADVRAQDHAQLGESEGEFRLLWTLTAEELDWIAKEMLPAGWNSPGTGNHFRGPRQLRMDSRSGAGGARPWDMLEGNGGNYQGEK